RTIGTMRMHFGHRVLVVRLGLVAAAALFVLSFGPGAAQTGDRGHPAAREGAPDAAPDGMCGGESPPATLAPSSRDLFCIDLTPSPRFPNASGTAELRRIPGPFAVT